LSFLPKTPKPLPLIINLLTELMAALCKKIN